MNLATFFINTLVVHDVPQRQPGVVDAVTFSDVQSPLTPTLKNFFRERVNGSLSRQSFEVQRFPTTPSPVPDAVEAIIADPSTLVDKSKIIAQHLWDSQTAVNSPGMLVACNGTIDGAGCVALLKLEREDGLRLEQTQVNGQSTFGITYLNDLMLGKNTRVFKAALFALDPQTQALDGLVSDDQRGYDPQSQVARFFLQRFLGCELKTADDVATKAFFETSQAWINGYVTDDSTKARYELALLAEVNSATATLNPATFATQHLGTDDRTAYRGYMTGEGVAPGTIAKDTSLIATRIAQLTLATHRGVRVSGRPEVIGEIVDVTTVDDQPVIQIRDQLRDVRGGR